VNDLVIHVLSFLTLQEVTFLPRSGSCTEREFAETFFESYLVPKYSKCARAVVKAYYPRLTLPVLYYPVLSVRPAVHSVMFNLSIPIKLPRLTMNV
jgi:hypothetical protein